MKFSLIAGLAAVPLLLAAPAASGHDSSVDKGGHEGGSYSSSGSSDHKAYDDKKDGYDDKKSGYDYGDAPTPTLTPLFTC
jgi:hypothetical protein